MAFLAGPEVAFVARGPTRVGAPRRGQYTILEPYYKKGEPGSSRNGMSSKSAAFPRKISASHFTS